MAFKMRSGKGTNFKDLGSSKSVFKQNEDPIYAPGQEPVYGVDKSGDRFLKEKDDAIKPKNWDRRRVVDEYVDRRGEHNRDYYEKDKVIPDPDNPGSYIKTPGKGGYVFDQKGDYDKGYGGHIEHRKVDLADDGYRNIDVRMGHSGGVDAGPEHRRGKGKYRYETMTSDGSDKFTTRVDTSREHTHDVNPYTTEFAGGNVQLSHARPVEFNEVTGRYEPVVNIDEGKFASTDKNRLAGISKPGQTRKIGGRTVTKGDVSHYVGDGREKYVETKGGNKLKAVQVGDDGKRRVLKTKMDDEGVITDKSAEGWLNLRNRKRFVDDEEVPAWFGGEAIQKYKKKRKTKKLNKAKDQAKERRVKRSKEEKVNQPKEKKEKKKLNLFKKNPDKPKKIKKPRIKRNKGRDGSSLVDEILGPKAGPRM